jgi:Cyanate permease
MKLTRSINLQGVVFTIDEDAYQLLKDYLSDIESRLPIDEKKDVMDDLESRIAELLQSALFAQKVESVTIEMIWDVRARIGEPDAFGENKRPVIKRERINRQGIGRVISIVLKAILIIIAIQVLFPVLAVVFALLMAFFGISIGGMALVPALGFELFGGSTAWTWVLCLSVIAALVMPVYMIVHWIVKYSRERKHPSLRFWIISLLIWLLSLGGLIASAAKALQVNGTDLVTVMETIDEWDDEDGNLIREVREVEPFNAIDASGAVKLEVNVGEPQAVNVRYAQSGSVTTEVVDGVLKVRGVDNHRGKAVISVPSLEAINLTGASRADVHGLTDELRAEINGASKLDADDLWVKNMRINVSGASKAEVNVTDSLWAQANGASKIEYKGNPAVQQSISLGASKIKRE